MRLLIAYWLAGWLTESIIAMIRWKDICELAQSRPWYEGAIAVPLIFMLAPIIRPCAYAYRHYRRFL